MGKLKILAGDIAPGVSFYTTPGAIRGVPLQEVLEADPAKIKAILGKKAPNPGRGICFVAVFTTGERAVIQTDAHTLLRIEADLAGGPMSRETVRRAGLDNSRAAIIFFVLFIAVWLLLGTLLRGWAAFILAFLVAMAGAVAAISVVKRIR